MPGGQAGPIDRQGGSMPSRSLDGRAVTAGNPAGAEAAVVRGGNVDQRTLARLWGVISAACGIQAAWRFPTDAHRSMDQSAVPSSQHLPQNGCMELQDQVKVAGFREMWQPVYSKYKAFFECAFKLQGIVGEMITSPVHGQLPQIIGQMAAAASNTYGAILTLVLNGFGNDAMKLARSLFEIELNILRLKNHPD